MSRARARRHVQRVRANAIERIEVDAPGDVPVIVSIARRFIEA
jgi:hypothetical protein